jgi:16S rRNA (cytosine967-C5)-methyltransferase
MRPGRAKNARAFALEALKRVEKDQAYLDLLVEHVLETSSLKEVDRRLFSELAYGTVRHRRLLDFYIEQALDRKIAQTDLTTRNILRLGAYQLFFLDRIPARAAVNETVELSIKYARPLVNAVLRRLSDKKAELKKPDDLAGQIARLATKYSHPDWMTERFLSQFGEEESEKFLEANNQRPELCLRVNTARTRREDLLEIFEKEQVATSRGKYSKFAVIVEDRVFPGRLPGYEEGLFAVQDQASQLVVMMLDPKPGETILDACAAPGTKTLEIFQLMQKSGKLVSADISEERLSLVSSEVKRLGLQGFEMLFQDMTAPLKRELQFDKILLDAPCSGLGTLRRHPEIKWQRTEADIQALSQLQKRLIKNLAQYLNPGGVMVYSTCTVTPEENQEVVATLLETGEFEPQDPLPYLPESAAAMVADKTFQTLPHRHNTDGFTAFRLGKMK